MTSGANASKKNKMADWNKECQQAFHKLKELCTNTPVLVFVDYSKHFKVHMVVSGLGFGAVLYQTQDDGAESE